MVLPVTSSAPVKTDTLAVARENDTRLQQLLDAHFSKDACPINVLNQNGGDFIFNFTVCDGLIYTLLKDKIRVLEFGTLGCVKEIPIALPEIPYHITIYDSWIVCAPQEAGILAVYDKTTGLQILVNLDRAFETREGGVQAIAVKDDALYLSMWSYPEGDLVRSNNTQQGHIVKLERDLSIKSLFSEADNHVSDFKIVDGKLYYANKNKVYSFDEATNTATEILDAGGYIFSFDITPDGQAVVEMYNDESSMCIKCKGGYLFYDKNGLKIRRQSDNKTVKKHDPNWDAYRVRVIDIYNGAILALNKNFDRMSSAIIIWPPK